VVSGQVMWLNVMCINYKMKNLIAVVGGVAVFL